MKEQSYTRNTRRNPKLSVTTVNWNMMRQKADYK